MNFDWYGASVDAAIDETAAALAGGFAGAALESTRPMHGFRQALALKREGAVLATVLWENIGRRDDDSCYVVGTGRNAPAVASLLRSWQPMHRVSRVDVAEDFSGEGTWDRLSTMALEVADLHGVKVEHAGDYHRALDGRSLYLGGRSSVAREIVYEKGIQIGGDPNHVRMELRVRPGSRCAKYQAAQMGPADLYGSSRWSMDLASRLGHPDIRRISLGTVYRDDDAGRAMAWLLKQYAPTLRSKKNELGSWAALGDYIGEKLGDG